MKTMLLKEAIQQGVVQVGDAKVGIIGEYVDYKPIKKTCVLTPFQTGWEKEQSFTTEQLHWRLEKVGSGVFLLPDEPTDSEIILYGKTGYELGTQTMYYFVNKLFSSPIANKVLVVNEGMVKEGISYCNKIHFLGTRYEYSNKNEDCVYYGIRLVSLGELRDGAFVFCSKNHSHDEHYSVRPAVSLKTDIHVVVSAESDGSKEKPWKILESKPISLPSYSNSDLEKLIKEGEEWLEKLKKYANEMK